MCKQKYNMFGYRTIFDLGHAIIPEDRRIRHFKAYENDSVHRKACVWHMCVEDDFQAWVQEVILEDKKNDHHEV